MYIAHFEIGETVPEKVYFRISEEPTKKIDFTISKGNSIKININKDFKIDEIKQKEK